MPEDAPTTPIHNETLRALFDRHCANQPVASATTARQRIRLLRDLEAALLKWRPKIREALYTDFQKPASEVDLVDIYYVLREIRHTCAHLRKWMRPVRVPTAFAFMGSRATVIHEPKGTALIIAPWNYPINLTLGPLVSALSAGCTAVLKPSEHTPHSSRLIKEMLATLYPENLVAVVEGDAMAAQQLLALPFNHIFFTGSTRIGKVIMEAAAKTLASVTLELGGKCPVFVEPSADISRAAHRIVQTKFANAGQTCIAPDYILVHASVHEQLLTALQDSINAFYAPFNGQFSDYAAMIHRQHLGKMEALIHDAVRHGAQIVTGGTVHEDSNTLAPTILDEVSLDATIMHQEIFGPILPVISYPSTTDAIRICNQLPRPLGLYVFGRGEPVKEILRETRAGGTCVNHCALNYYNASMPFGGINDSGIGKCHGYYGFEAFSNARGIYRQTWRFAPIDWMHPPYFRSKQRLVDFILKWL